jgi:hypothetical protein
MDEKLTDNNFVIFCAKIYDNPQLLSTEEFMEDLERIKHIKKLITRFIDTGELKERLILNHLITLQNCFGQHLAKIMFLKTEKYFPYIKPFLILMSALPKYIYNVNEYKLVDTDIIHMNVNIIEALRKINDGNKYS